MNRGKEAVPTVGSSLSNGWVVLANLVYEGLPDGAIITRTCPAWKNAQGPELLYPTFNSQQSAILFIEDLTHLAGLASLAYCYGHGDSDVVEPCVVHRFRTL